MARKVEDRSLVGVARARASLGRSLPRCLPSRLVWMTCLLNSFSLVPLLVGICAEMDDTSFEFMWSCSAGGRDLRGDGSHFI